MTDLINIWARTRRFTEMQLLPGPDADTIIKLSELKLGVRPKDVARPETILAVDAAVYALSAMHDDLNWNSAKYEKTMSPEVAAYMAHSHAQAATDHAVDLWLAWNPAVTGRMSSESVSDAREFAAACLHHYLFNNFRVLRENEPEKEPTS